MLTPEDRRVRQAKASEHEDRQRSTSRGTGRVLGLELLDLVQRPCVPSLARFEPLDAVARVNLRLADFNSPCIERTDRLDDVVSGARAVDPRIADSRHVLSLEEIGRLFTVLDADVFEKAAPAAHRVHSDRIGGSPEILLAKPTEGSRDNGLGRVRDHRSLAIGYALFGTFILAQKRGRARLSRSRTFFLALTRK